MASRLSDVGFRIEAPAVLALAEDTCRFGEQIAVHGGRYCYWAVGEGVELWVARNPRGQFVGLAPHFSGAARMRMGLTARLASPGGPTAGVAARLLTRVVTGKPIRPTPALAGCFHAWADPSGEDPESGAYPLVFDAPDFATHAGLLVPGIVTVQVAAFAQELRVFADDAAYDAEPRDGLRMAAESLIPSGLFAFDEEDPAEPRPVALLGGHVLAAEQRVNPATRQPFWWAHVRTFGGEVDIVADPDLVNAPMEAGGIVQGEFWLSGRIIREAAIEPPP
ncbi:MAG TPA: hypothetical protein VM536_22435 [Chloroflexia bacterium]|nr:hypothetical protein [Chloroflexia bacterium]